MQNQESVSLGGMGNKVRFALNRLGERLWVKPLFSCVLSLFAVIAAGLADQLVIFDNKLPHISFQSLETLLSVMAASMLVIATFAVGAMLSAFTSASDAATPRTLSLVIADDVSQNALSTFIGAFIFSIVGLVAHLNTLFEQQGTFVLFVLTLVVFAIVILSFVRWVDRIARLGRLGETIGKVENVLNNVLQSYARFPTLCTKQPDEEPTGTPVFSEHVGYVQQLDVKQLQELAEKNNCRIFVRALPGEFISLAEPLVLVDTSEAALDEQLTSGIAQAFRVGRSRTFDEDPRFGMVVLSEIASRALSPAVNDPGTAIDIIRTMVRLISKWAITQQRSAEDGSQEQAVMYDRVFVPELSVRALLDDAFSAIARDGAGLREVTACLQESFISLRLLGHEALDPAVIYHSEYALGYALSSLCQQGDLDHIRSLSEQAQAKDLRSSVVS